MTITAARTSLAALFLAALVIQAAIFFELVREHALSPAEAWPILKTLALTYSVPLTVVIGGVFALHQNPRSRPRPFTFSGSPSRFRLYGTFFLLYLWFSISIVRMHCQGTLKSL